MRAGLGPRLAARRCPAATQRSSQRAHRVWLMPSCFAPVSGSAATPHSQNFMSWSALPLTKPLESGRADSDHTGPLCPLQQMGCL